MTFPVVEPPPRSPQSAVYIAANAVRELQLRQRFSTPAISVRTWETVNAGVRIFSPPGLLREEPGRD